MEWAPDVRREPAPERSIAGRFKLTPQGVIIHSSRSGVDRSALAEFKGTVQYAKDGAPVYDEQGNVVAWLGWNATITDGLVAEHIPPTHYGWNARAHSTEYLALEMSQARPGDPIGDLAVKTAAWYIVYRFKREYPDLPMVFPMHSELPAGIRDKKSDLYPAGPDAAAFRLRLMEAIKEIA